VGTPLVVRLRYMLDAARERHRIRCRPNLRRFDARSDADSRSGRSEGIGSAGLPRRLRKTCGFVLVKCIEFHRRRRSQSERLDAGRSRRKFPGPISSASEIARKTTSAFLSLSASEQLCGSFGCSRKQSRVLAWFSVRCSFWCLFSRIGVRT
jgi:hypothetical protein